MRAENFKQINIIYSKISVLTIFGLILFLFAGTIRAQVTEYQPPELQKATADEHLGQKIPLDLVFTNEHGEQEQIGKYFHQGKPVILVMAYYTCPMLCTFVLNGVATSLRQIDWDAGKDFQVLTVSIDSIETPEQAAAKKATLIKGINRPGIDEGWRFFVGKGNEIRALAGALGFNYYWDNTQKMYAHPTVIFVLTEDGTISRYLYGIDYKKQDVKLALLEASRGKIGNTIDRLLLYCYHYDPNAKGYVLFAANLMKLAGILTVFLMAALLGMLWSREHGRNRDIKKSGETETDQH